MELRDQSGKKGGRKRENGRKRGIRNFIHNKSKKSVVPLGLCVNLTHARIIWEEAITTKKMLACPWPGGKSVGHFLNW